MASLVEKAEQLQNGSPADLERFWRELADDTNLVEIARWIEQSRRWSEQSLADAAYRKLANHFVDQIDGLLDEIELEPFNPGDWPELDRQRR